MDIFKGTSESNQLFVRDCWYVAAWGHEIVEDNLYAICIANEPIVIYRKENGDLVALRNQCCHRLTPLSKGRIEGDHLRCMYHGLKFAPDGKCVEIPGQDIVGDQFRVHCYPVVEMHSWVWIWIGDPAVSHLHPIPPVTGLQDPQWFLKPGSMDYAANYLLINDNLLDLSHVAYLHLKGLDADVGSKFPASVSLLERGVTVKRWRTGQTWGKHIPGSVDRKYDEFLCYDFLMPGIFLMYIGLFELGTAVRSSFGKPDEKVEPLHAQFSSQAVTGMTDASSRYFFSIGPRRIEHFQHPGIVEMLWESTRHFFAEDRDMIEAQQKSILEFPEGRTNSIASDRGPMMMRRLMDKYIKEGLNKSPMIVDDASS